MLTFSRYLIPKLSNENRLTYENQKDPDAFYFARLTSSLPCAPDSSHPIDGLYFISDEYVRSSRRRSLQISKDDVKPHSEFDHQVLAWRFTKKVSLEVLVIVRPNEELSFWCSHRMVKSATSEEENSTDNSAAALECLDGFIDLSIMDKLLFS